jgi:hypothetical protein
LSGSLRRFHLQPAQLLPILAQSLRVALRLQCISDPRLPLLRLDLDLQIKRVDWLVWIVQKVIEIPRPQSIPQAKRPAAGENDLPVPARPPEHITQLTFSVPACQRFSDSPLRSVVLWSVVRGLVVSSQWSVVRGLVVSFSQFSLRTFQRLPRGKLIHGGQFLGRCPGKDQHQLA